MTSQYWRPAYVGIGSNLHSPVTQVEEAILALNDLPETLVALRSGLFRSRPLGPADQPDFVNAVVALMTRLEPHDLLARLKRLEKARGREDGRRWGPRLIDLDLLALASLTLQDGHLTLPHPGIAERNFVLLPWAEIAPHYAVPGLATVAELARRAPAEPLIERLA